MAGATQQPKLTGIHSLNMGSNGSAKTGALAALLKAGYKIRMLAFESGAEILVNIMREKEGWTDEQIDAALDIELCLDEYHMFGVPGKQTMRAKAATAFPKAMKVMANWPGYGSPLTWGDDVIFVIDTLTSNGRACLNFTFEMKGKLTDLDKDATKISQPDWGDAMKLQEDLMAMTMSMPCHVIVNSHITFLTPDGELSDKGFPSALGSKLPPKIGGYFNHILHFTKQGVGMRKTRGFTPTETGLVETKTSSTKVDDWYPLSMATPTKDGLAKYFSDIRGPLKPK